MSALTSDLARRIAGHNAGQNAATARDRPCRLLVSNEFEGEPAAARAERRVGNETVSLAAAAAERYLKATLAEANQAFEYTHNIDRLYARLDQDVRTALASTLTPRVQQQLSDGGTAALVGEGPPVDGAARRSRWRVQAGSG